MTDGLVAGRFRIRALLGSGGTASVFAADDEDSGRRIALKLLHPHLAVERSVWEAFFEEVHAAQSIDHPGLAEIYDAGVEDSDPPIVWIAMERVDGASLSDQIRDHGPLGAAEAVALISAVLDALAAAHGGGVVHRDITPANIMFDPAFLDAGFDPVALGDSVRLLDFGLADVPGRSTVGADALLSGVASEHAGVAIEGVVASVPYASPEQLSASAVREASDLYQVGATLHFALTGRAPFAGDTAAVVRAHLSAPPPVPSASRKGLPRALDRVVTTAMLKRPEDRYPDAATMRVALLAAASPVRAVHPTREGATTDALAESMPDLTGVTRVYRTAVPLETVPAAGTSLLEHVQGGGGWRIWAVAAGLIAALTAIVGLSAMAASTAPSPADTVAPFVSHTPSPVAESPAPVESSVPTASVPELAGLSVADARVALERAGLSLGEVARENSSLAADTVLGSSPNAGADLSVGAAVSVRIATGENAVPSVVGLAPADAVGVLSAAGFPAHVTEVTDGTPGLVTGSSPAAGGASRVGSTVIVYVARAVTARPTPPPTATPTPDATPEPSGSPSVSP